LGATITAVEVVDIRFPTSLGQHGSDAMHPDPDYSAAYVTIRTDDVDGLAGFGFTFTIGRGNELCVNAIQALSHLVVGRHLDDITADMAGFWRSLTGDSQLRWVGPEKGVIHLATAALVNAVWDLWARASGRPLWRLVVEMSPAQLVSCIDFTYLTDAITPGEAVELLARREPDKVAREAELQRTGMRAYTTSAGWLGYPDDEIRRLAREAIDEGFDAFKQKVGADLDDDRRRAGILRAEIGPRRRLMMDANQRWDVEIAIAWMRELAAFDPYWIEEPTSPDDILGHAQIAEVIAPVKVATGEHVHNRVMFKQFLAAKGMGICQIDACRLGGVNEVLAVLLLAAKAGVPVCPHAGGVGLCELVAHHAAIDQIAIAGSGADKMVEYVDHLHEHFVDPVRMHHGAYLLPDRPGFSGEIRAESIDRYRYPDGGYWQERTASRRVGVMSIAS
jgi:L-fuconate dehydratase